MNRYLVSFLLAFFASLFLTPLVRRLAVKHGFIAYPRSDRWHKHPTALLGGVGIYLAAVLAMLVTLPFDKATYGLLAGATLLFAVGLADDKYHFTPYVKLFAQILAGGIAVFSGMEMTEAELFRPLLPHAGLAVRDETSDAGWWAVAAARV